MNAQKQNRLFVVIAIALSAASAQATLLYNQAPHAPGAVGPPPGNGISNFQDPTIWDREICDDFTVTGNGWIVDQVDITGMWDSAPFQVDPAGGFEVAFFQKIANMPAAGPMYGTISTSFVGTATGVSYFGLESRHWLIDIAPVVLAPADYYVMIQPRDNKNFYQLTSTPTTPLNGTVFFLRGAPGDIYPAGPTWTPGFVVVNQDHDLAFSLHGSSLVPEPSTAAALAGLAGLAQSRRFRTRRK